MSDLFQILTVDPPWFYQNWTAKKNGAAQAHYPGMKIEELAQLPIGKLGAKNSLCFLWVTGPKLLEDAHTILFKAWGYRPATIFLVWVKTYRRPLVLDLGKKLKTSLCALLGIPNDVFTGVKTAQLIPGNWCHGNGFYTAANCEFLVLGVRGALPRKPLLEKQLMVAQRPPLHSAKPNDEVRRRMKVIFPDYDSYRKIEIFARPPVPSDWSALGNEIDGRDIHDSLPKLLEELGVHNSEEGS